MSEPQRPQIYLITPPELDLSVFPDILAATLDAADVACVRLALSSQDETHISRAAETLRALTHARDIPLVIETHVALVQRLGLDGVHLTDGARSVRQVRTELGSDAIVGTYCGTSRHDGMNAAEAGADYVSFGPVGSSALGHGNTVETDVFAWWSEVIEVPVVAEGGIDEQSLATLLEITDFIGIGPEIWHSENPPARLAELTKTLG